MACTTKSANKKDKDQKLKYKTKLLKLSLICFYTNLKIVDYEKCPRSKFCVNVNCRLKSESLTVIVNLQF